MIANKTNLKYKIKIDKTNKTSLINSKTNKSNPII